jgi:hypothetical protein
MENTGESEGTKLLFKIGGVAALVAAIVFRRNLSAEFELLRSMGAFNNIPARPETVSDWFALLQSHALVGLTLLNVFDIVNYALVGLIFLALYAALRPLDKSLMPIAAVLGLIGVTVYFAGNQAFTMFSLSGQYAAAATDAVRAQLLSAGEAVRAVSYNAGYEGGGPYVSLLFVTAAGLLLSLVMLRSRTFGKVTAWFGILANVFGLSYYLVLAVFPPLVALPVSISAVFLLVWYIMIGVKLLRAS